MRALDSSTYYVYAHDIAGKVFYIGMGRGARAFTTVGRNPAWTKHVKTSSAYRTRILKVFSTKREALDYETQKISKLRPLANSNGIGRLIKIKNSNMDASEMGKKGARVTNKILTTETRRAAAKKGWRDRRKKQKELKHR